MPAELDQMDPGMDQSEMDPGMDQSEMNPGMDSTMPQGETDQEGAMAKQELIKLANYAENLQQHIQDDDQLEAWCQAKITMAAQNIASVYHYMAYEKKIGEYGDALENTPMSESMRRAITGRLMEAKEKVKELKKVQAMKVKASKEEKMDEGMMEPCNHCGGAGHIKRELAPHAHKLIDKHKKLHNFIDKKIKDANHNGIDDDKELDEEMSSTGGTITRTKTGLRHSHNPARFSDEPHAEPVSNAKSRSASEKSGEKATNKADEKESKAWGKANPGKQTIMKGGVKTTNEAKKEKKAGKDYDGDGKIESNKDEVWGSRAKAAAKAGHPFKEAEDRTMSRAAKGVMKYGKDGMKSLAKAGKEGKSLEPVKAKYNKYDESTKQRISENLDQLLSHYPKEVEHFKAHGELDRDLQDVLWDYYFTNGEIRNYDADASEFIADRLAYHLGIDESLKEGKPSAGLSKAKKSAVVKKAKAGGDIGKPGKSFKDIAKKSGGGEKGEKIAAAAMWKNMKETTAYIAEKAKPDFLDMDKDGDKKEPMKKAVADKKKETVKESSDMTRLLELTGRLNQNERKSIVESGEVSEIRALTKRLLG